MKKSYINSNATKMSPVLKEGSDGSNPFQAERGPLTSTQKYSKNK